MFVKVTQSGKSTKIGIDDINQRKPQAIRRAFYNIGKDLRKSAKDSILDKNKTGRIYNVYVTAGGQRRKRVRRHQASAPGQAPANLFGSLWRSLDFIVNGSTELVFGSKSVASNGKKVPYGVYLEDGTDRIAPRPFISKAVKDNYRNMQKRFEFEIDKLENDVIRL